VNGTIFQLPIQNPGAVVQPGTLVAQIAPQGAKMVLRSQIASQDMGFLKVGLPVKVKLDAYPFQDYGVIPGRLTWIAPDSKVVQAGQTQREVFELEIELAQPYIEAGDKRIQLTPGQTATAEVVVRQRRVIDFLTDPFKQLQKGGLNF
jgi:hemolysin D